jgi:signal peptidase II
MFMTQRRTTTLLPARRSTLAWVLMLGITMLGLSLDLWSKAWAFEHVAGEPVVLVRHELLNRPEAVMLPPDRVEALPWGLLDFQLMLNSGAVFGLGAGHRGLLIAFTAVAIAIALWIFGWRTTSKSHVVHIGIGLVLAGALGNLWDRMSFGRVRDFLYMLPDWQLPFGFAWPGGRPEVWPWIFNVADVLLLVGLGLIFIHMYRVDKAERRDSDGESGTPKPAAGG